MWWSLWFLFLFEKRSLLVWYINTLSDLYFFDDKKSKIYVTYKFSIYY